MILNSEVLAEVSVSFIKRIHSITLMGNNENVSGSKIVNSYVFPSAELKNHHKNDRLVLALEIK